MKPQLNTATPGTRQGRFRATLLPHSLKRGGGFEKYLDPLFNYV